MRIKKPQLPALLTGQLFCMLIWLFRQSNQSYASTVASAFDIIEAEFGEWDNVQIFIANNGNRLVQELTSIFAKLPLQSSLMPFMINMHKKIQINQTILSRSTGLSLERLLSVIKTVVSWHVQTKPPHQTTSPSSKTTVGQQPLRMDFSRSVISQPSVPSSSRQNGAKTPKPTRPYLQSSGPRPISKSTRPSAASLSKKDFGQT